MTTTLQACGLQTVVARTTSEIQDIRAEWGSLNAQHAQVLAAHNDPGRYLAELAVRGDGLTPHIALFRDENGPRGIIAGKIFDYITRCRIGYLKFPLVTLKCFGVTYGGLVSDGSNEAKSAIFDYLQKIRRDRQFDFVMINHLPTSHELYPRLREERPDTAIGDVHWRWWLGKTPEQSLSHRSPKTRSTMRRHEKRLAAQFKTGLQLRRWERESEVDEFCTIAGQIAAKGYQSAMNVGYSDSPLWRAFVREEARQGRMRCYTLEGDGQAIAFQVGVNRRGVYTMEETAFLPEFRINSPGQVLLLKIMQDLCENGALAIDYGLGDASYKESFSTERTEETTFYFYGRGAKARFAKNTLAVCDGLTGTVDAAIRRAGIRDWIKRKWRRRLEAHADA